MNNMNDKERAFSLYRQGPPSFTDYQKYHVGTHFYTRCGDLYYLSFISTAGADNGEDSDERFPLQCAVLILRLRCRVVGI